jgi:glucose-6-phosphate 1-dehydrogenase
MKTPGAGFEVQNVNMNFHYADLAHHRIPSAYERLLYDSIRGDATLFARTEEVLHAWGFLEPILTAWRQDEDIPLHGYPAGTWGPSMADELIEEDMTWRYPCKNLTDNGNYCEL